MDEYHATTKCAKVPARQSRNQKNRSISREDAKAQSKKRFPNLAFLASWREEYPNPRVSRCEKFARLAQILKYSSTKWRNSRRLISGRFVCFVVACLLALGASAV